MKKEFINAYTTLSNNILWLKEHAITSREAREALACATADFDEIPDGEEKGVLIEKAAELGMMLSTTYVFWCKNGTYYEEDDNVLANECRANGVPYGVETNPLKAAQAVWKKQEVKENAFFPIDYFIA